ncbi:exopolysaccharide biosynthesis polyprenyl glycosylphosphotransferase [Enterovirga sp.]|uniref:exopolysaccharide biosynthesis polyprenyl glycosylphosphotransferase n=1 Tax=Enterovirga sp. TaxID=2026350 RepID=UPI002630E109|nr:exopolysaccharide biosynthesis polyprenyl glycosylphosphotransferase [Enterovirga sp.]MDB5591862.1 undecaprenyl-phosphate glucose phosphotransferase [Enterovirga sp.]
MSAPRYPGRAEGGGRGLQGALELRSGLGPDRRRYERRWETVRWPVPWAVLAVPIVLLDGLALGAATIAVGEVHDRIALGAAAEFKTHLSVAALNVFLVLTIATAAGRYRASELVGRADRQGGLLFVLLAGFASAAVVQFLTQTSAHASATVLAGSFVAAFPLLSLVRSLVMKGLRESGVLRLVRKDKVLVVAAADHLDRAAALLDRPLLDVVGRAPLPLRTPGSGELDYLLAIARRIVPDTVVIHPAAAPREVLVAVVSRLTELPCAVLLGTDPDIASVDGLAGGTVGLPLGALILGPPLTRAERAAKRGLDVGLASVALLACTPVLLLASAMIWLESGRPVFFRQTRYGFNRRPFQVWKFRTLLADESRQPFRQVTVRDERVTSVGRLLRRTNIDELPQLLNVLGGSMSLVGPRPHPVELDDQFSPLIAHYARRHKIRPGITGWAQINGHRGQTDTTEKMEQRIAHDLYYLSNWSLMFDLKIMLLTVVSAKSYNNAG